MYDLEAYMEDETDGIPFVVVRSIECSGASVLMARDGGSLRWTESIYIKSSMLKTALRRIASCYYQPLAKEYMRITGPTTSSTGAYDDIELQFEQNRLTPPDLFLYHHRHALSLSGLQHYEMQQHIYCLLSHTEAQRGALFAEAESLFSHGLVDQSHVRFLYKPNDILLAGTYGRPAGFVLQEWPQISSDNWITLLCWSFQPDGSGFARKRITLSIAPLGPNTQEIRSLVAYPLRFAAPELRDAILARGRKYWQLRTPSQITYKGWNVRKDQFYVSSLHMIILFLKLTFSARCQIYDRLLCLPQNA